MRAAIAAAVLWAPMLAAQDRTQDGSAKIPESAMPPAGQGTIMRTGLLG